MQRSKIGTRAEGAPSRAAGRGRGAVSEGVMSSSDSQLLIGGEWVDGANGGYDIVNPATETVVAAAPEASAAQAQDAARAAKDAFESWSRTTPQQRAELLAKAGEAIKANYEKLLPLVIAET